RRVLVDHGERALAVGAQDELARGIERDAVHHPADRQLGDAVAVVRVEDDQLAVGAAGEEPPVLAVHRQARGLLARSQRPAVQPRPSVGANATPWTPGVSGMSPATLSDFKSTAWTCVPCVTNRRPDPPSTAR